MDKYAHRHIHIDTRIRTTHTHTRNTCINVHTYTNVNTLENLQCTNDTWSSLYTHLNPFAEPKNLENLEKPAC